MQTRSTPVTGVHFRKVSLYMIEKTLKKTINQRFELPCMTLPDKTMSKYFNLLMSSYVG